jgi:hypothetical protein
MHVTLMRTAVPMLLVLTLGALSFAGESQKPPASSAPSIEGTYQLTSRQLPDGMMLRPPAIMGLNTYTKSHRTFNVVRKDAAGQFFSSSNVHTWPRPPLHGWGIPPTHLNPSSAVTCWYIREPSIRM